MQQLVAILEDHDFVAFGEAKTRARLFLKQVRIHAFRAQEADAMFERFAL